MGSAACLKALGMAVVYGLYLPLFARELYGYAPEYRYAFWPCLAYSLGSALPCLAALIAFVRVIRAVQGDRSFSCETEKSIRFIARMAFAEGIYLIVGVVLSCVSGVGSPGLVVILFGLSVIALVIGLLASALARLIDRASAMREENDLTV